jgi:DNA replication protein DnaC
VTEEIKSVGELIAAFPKLTQEMVVAASLKYSEECERSGRPVQAEVARKELEGGNCAVCGKAYEKKEEHNAFADFTFFRAVCLCEASEREREDLVLRAELDMEDAGVPPLYIRETFENWDYGKPDDAEAAKANAAMKEVSDYVRTRTYRAQGLMLYGPPGTGKTRLAACVLRAACIEGLRVSFQRVAQIVGRMTDRTAGSRFVSELSAMDVVVFDDVDKVNAENEWVRDQIFGVVDALIGARKCPVLTTNLLTVSEMEAKLGSSVVSRLLSGCAWVEVLGEDYRKRIAMMNLERRKK